MMLHVDYISKPQEAAKEKQEEWMGGDPRLQPREGHRWEALALRSRKGLGRLLGVVWGAWGCRVWPGGPGERLGQEQRGAAGEPVGVMKGVRQSPMFSEREAASLVSEAEGEEWLEWGSFTLLTS